MSYYRNNARRRCVRRAWRHGYRLGKKCRSATMHATPEDKRNWARFADGYTAGCYEFTRLCDLLEL